ncbi:MAG: dipeptide epimerase [Thermoplasmata archaeon]
MISNVFYKKLNLPMTKPFRISLGSSEYYEGYILKIQTDDGIMGFGEAVPTPYITGDTMESIEGELKNLKRILIGEEESQENVNEILKKNFKGSKASRAAVDMAIWDIIGKRANLPVYKIIGGSKKDIKTSLTVDLAPPEEAKEMASQFLNEGIKVFKIKLGSGIQEDVERVKQVRNVIGNEKMIYVDFNQAYDAKHTLKVIDAIEKYDIEFIEQPVPAWDLKSLKFIKERTNIPIMADESLVSIHDLKNIVHFEAADMINIKLMKTGGITDAIKLVDAAELFDISVMIGCMVETKLAVAAGLNIAMGKRWVKYADLDGFTSLKEEITEDGLELKNGELMLKDYPGLGVKLKDVL